ncbi:hypothetical protein V6N13_091808 [Hibiscus sabdariffa]
MAAASQGRGSLLHFAFAYMVVAGFGSYWWSGVCGYRGHGCCVAGQREPVSFCLCYLFRKELGGVAMIVVLVILPLLVTSVLVLSPYCFPPNITHALGKWGFIFKSLVEVFESWLSAFILYKLGQWMGLGAAGGRACVAAEAMAAASQGRGKLFHFVFAGLGATGCRACVAAEAMAAASQGRGSLLHFAFAGLGAAGGRACVAAEAMAAASQRRGSLFHFVFAVG